MSECDVQCVDIPVAALQKVAVVESSTPGSATLRCNDTSCTGQCLLSKLSALGDARLQELWCNAPNDEKREALSLPRVELVRHVKEVFIPKAKCCTRHKRLEKADYADCVLSYLSHLETGNR